MNLHKVIKAALISNKISFTYGINNKLKRKMKIEKNYN